jgi:murein DD-endopeptidase MepM/ murein hydrolase activator NlpD
VSSRQRWLCLLVGLAGCAAEPALAPRTSTLREVTVEPCVPLEWPVDAEVSSLFGRRDGRPHLGIDLAAPEGTPVRAACAGVVTFASDRLRGYGRLIIVEHGSGTTTVYAHNQTLFVSVGAAVARGQVIARSGATGRVTAPHLHFEVRQKGRPVDPLGLLPARGRPPIAGSGMGYAAGTATFADVSSP